MPDLRLEEDSQRGRTFGPPLVEVSHGKGYSLDLCERVVARVGAGMSRRQAAKQFAVSESCAIKLLNRFETTGLTQLAPTLRKATS